MYEHIFRRLVQSEQLATMELTLDSSCVVSASSGANYGMPPERPTSSTDVRVSCVLAIVLTVIFRTVPGYRQSLITPGGSVDHLTGNDITESWDLCLAQVSAIDRYFHVIFCASVCEHII